MSRTFDLAFNVSKRDEDINKAIDWLWQVWLIAIVGSRLFLGFDNSFSIPYQEI
jgi:hypothetical protein